MKKYLEAMNKVLYRNKCDIIILSVCVAVFTAALIYFSKELVCIK